MATFSVAPGRNSQFYSAGGSPRTQQLGAILNVLQAAAASAPPSISRVEVFSGQTGRSTGTKNHPNGRAIDVRLYDASGNMIKNYLGKQGVRTAEDKKAYQTYEQFAQQTRQIQMRDYPQLGNAFRWGGYFAGGVNPLDLMHFDLSGELIGPQTSLWKNGLTAAGLPRGVSLGAGALNGLPQTAAVPPSAPPEAPQRTIKKGDEGMDVAALQMRLQNAGLYNGEIDGKFGAKTAEAVRATERAANLRIDKGVAGPQVQGVLANSLPQFPGNPAPQPGMDPMLASYRPPIMAHAPTLAGPMDTAAFGFGQKLPPAAMFPSGGPVPPASIPAPYAGNGPGRSPIGPAPIAMSPTLGTKDDTVAPSDPALTASNPFQMPQPWGPVADQSVDTLANRLPAPSSAPGFGLLASNGTYASLPRSAWTGDSSVMSKTFRDPFGMPSSSPALPSSVPFGFAQAGGAGNVMNGADVSGGRNLALMGRAPVNMANATPAATTTPALMRNDANAQSFGNFLRSIGTAFGGASTANASVPAARYDPLSSARMPMAPAMPAINQPAPATITPQQFQQRFAPMGTSSIPQDVTYRVASLNPVVSNSVSMAPKTISKADFNARFADPATPTSKLAPSPFALGGAASGVLAPSASPLGAALAGAGGFGIGVPQEPAPVQMTPMRKVARVAVPIAASMALGPVAGLAARGIMGLINGGPLANRVGQAISYVNAVARSNPYAASPFTPAGFSAPNFNPTSGGSIYASHNTAPGVGTFINSAGRTVGFNVNADQRVYGNYSGGFGGFQP